MSLILVVGARPNFMKAAPVVRALKKRRIDHQLVHTGQHYDAEMSQVFFDELGLPRPDVDLGVGSANHAQQTARIMSSFDELLDEHPKTRIVVVFGDVNSTVATSLVAVKRGLSVAHVEAGLRSGDRSMPEEINRILTDQLSELLFVTEPSGVEHLRREGRPESAIHLVGNCMVDTLLDHAGHAKSKQPWLDHDLDSGGYGLLTLHRPANVDDPAMLERLLSVLEELGDELPILFPVHPRTRSKIEALDFKPKNLRLLGPLPYLEFVGLMAGARIVLTDSGGIQEETTVLGIPCLTLRDNTERPLTLTLGSNRLVGRDPEAIRAGWIAALSSPCSIEPPPLWDGSAGERIADHLLAALYDHLDPSMTIG